MFLGGCGPPRPPPAGRLLRPRRPGRLLGADAGSCADDEEQNGRHGRDRDAAEVSYDHAGASWNGNAGSMTDGYARMARARYRRSTRKGLALDGEARFVYNRRFRIGVLPSVRKWRNWQTRKPQELVTAR